MQNKEKEFFKLVNELLLEQMKVQEVSKQTSLYKPHLKNPELERPKPVKRTEEEQKKITELSKKILSDLKVLPMLNVTDTVGSSAKVAEEQRESSEKLLSVIMTKGSSFEERLAWLTRTINKSVALDANDFISTMILLKTLKDIIENYREQTSGMLFENFFAQLAGGKSLPGKDIQDVQVGNRFYSLKLLSKGTAIEGSLLNLLNLFIQHPSGVEYVIAIKDKETVKDLTVDEKTAKVTSSVTFYTKRITPHVIERMFFKSLEKDILPDAFIQKYSDYYYNEQLIINPEIAQSPILQLKNFLSELEHGTKSNLALFKEIISDFVIMNGGKTSIGFSGTSEKNLYFKLSQSFFLDFNATEIGNITISAENLYDFYSKNYSKAYEGYVEILEVLSQQINSINTYLTTGNQNVGLVAVEQTERTRRLLDASVSGG